VGGESTAVFAQGGIIGTLLGCLGAVAGLIVAVLAIAGVIH